MYVFDCGYLDDAHFDRMIDDGYFFVSRPRKNTVVHIVKKYDPPSNSTIISDKMVVLRSVEIADVYKSRWAIELFFKWMKQHLSIKKFSGHSEQTVHNQV